MRRLRGSQDTIAYLEYGACNRKQIYPLDVERTGERIQGYSTVHVFLSKTRHLPSNHFELQRSCVLLSNQICLLQRQAYNEVSNIRNIICLMRTFDLSSTSIHLYIHVRRCQRIQLKLPPIMSVLGSSSCDPIHNSLHILVISSPGILSREVRRGL